MSNRIKSESIYRIVHVPGEEASIEDHLDDIQSYHEFDPAGRLVLEIAYENGGEITDKTEYRYDNGGKLLETKIFGEDDEVLERKEIFWKDEKRIGREIIHYLDGSQDVHEFFYDETGKLTGIVVKDEEEETEFTEKYFYSDGRLVRVERLDEHGEILFRQEDEYSGEVIKTRTIWSNEEEEPFRIVQHFNPRGQRLEELRYDSRDKLVERNNYEIDDHGRVAAMTEENRQRKNTTVFTYDDAGNVVYQKETDLHGVVNHEVRRFYNDNNEPEKTVAEMLIRPSMERRAYTLIFRREYYPS